MWIHLRHNEMIDIEQFCKTGHGQIVVHRTINPFSVRVSVPGHLLARFQVLGEQFGLCVHKGY